MRALLEKAKIRVAAWAAEKLFGGDVRVSAGSSLFRTGQDRGKRTTDALLKAYSERPYLAGPADQVSTDVGAIEWRLYRVTGPDGTRTVRPISVQRSANPRLRRKHVEQLREAGRLQEIPDHPLLDLLHDPNPDMAGSSWLKLVQLYLDLVGDAPSVIVPHESGVMRGLPMQLWPVPVTWIKRQGRDLFLDPPGTATRLRIDPDDLLWLRDFDPHNPYSYGVGVARTLSDEIDIAEYAAKEIKSRLSNGTLWDFLVTLKDSKPEEAKRLKAHLLANHRGPYKRGGMEVTNREMKVEKLSQSFEDWQAKDLIPMQRDAIRMRFGVPPEILGDAKDSNRATITGASIIYNSRVIDPRMDRLRQALQSKLVALYDERLLLDYVSPIPEDEDFKLEAMKEAPHHFTRDEWRALAGKEPAEDNGDEYWGNPVNQPLRSIEDGPAVLKLVDTSRRPVEIKGRFTDEDASDVFWQAVQRISDRLEPHVRRRFLGAIEALQDAMDDAAEDILRKLRAGNVEAIIDALPWNVFRGEFAGAADELKGILLSAMDETGKLAAAEAATQLGVEISFAIENERAVRAATERAATLIREITDRQRDTVRQIVGRALQEGRVPDRDLYVELRERIGLTERQEAALHNFEARLIEEGASEAQVARRVERQRNAVLRRRAQTIGRTETIWASNAGSHELIQQTVEQGIASRDSVRRFWITTPDSRLCPVCEPMPFLDDNLKVGPNDVFTTGIGGTVLHAPAHPMCRCGVGWEIEDPSAIDPDRSIRMDGLAKAVARLDSEEAA